MNLQQLLYVDGLETPPSTGQIALEWIKNGTLLKGATQYDSRDGNLNQNAVRLQKNIEIIDKNTHLLKDGIDLNAKAIQTVIEDIGSAGDITLIQTVHDQGVLLDQHTQDIHNNALSIVDVSDRVTPLEEQIGTPVEQSVKRTINDDLFWVKNELGQYSNQDINGVPVAGNEATGLKYKFEQIGVLATRNETEIANLSDKIDNANIEAIKQNVADIRRELGNVPIPETTVYSRLKTNEDKIGSLETDRNLIIEAIDLNNGKIIDKVNTIQNKQNEFEADINGTNGIEERLLSVTNVVNDPETGLVKVSQDNTNSITGLVNIVGEDDTTGLRKKVLNIETVVGISSDGQPVVGSIDDRVRTLTNIQNEQASTIQDVQNDMFGLQESINEYNDSRATLFRCYNKQFAIIGDATFKLAMNQMLVDSLKAIPFANNINSTAGIDNILGNVVLPNMINSEYTFVFLGTYDYLFNTTLGSLADASTEYAGTGSFYNSLFKLFNTLLVENKLNKVFIANGYKPFTYEGSTVHYPAANGKGHKLEDYAKAIKEVSEMFSVPVIDTLNKSCINFKNLDMYSNSDGLISTGIQRMIEVITNEIN